MLLTNMNKIFSSNNIKKGLTYLVLIALGYYLYKNFYLITDTVKTLTVSSISVILILKVLMIAINGEILITTLKCFDTEIERSRSYYITLISTIANFLTPFRGGAAIRALYLKKYHNISYTHFASTLSAYYILVLFISSISGSLAILFLDRSSLTQYLLLLGLFIGILIISLVLLFANVHRFLKTEVHSKNKFLNKIFSFIRQFILGWDYITKNKKVLTQLIIYSLISHILIFFISFIEFHSINIQTSMTSMLTYTSLSNISLLISITPGSLGIREAIFIFSSQVLNISNDAILQVAVIDRSTTLLVILLLYVFVTVLKRLPRFRKVDV